MCDYPLLYESDTMPKAIVLQRPGARPTMAGNGALAIAAVILLCVLPAWAQTLPGENQALRVRVEVEEEVYRYVPADNGASPMWCSGSTCLVRSGQEVFASGLETLEQYPPLNNCRWVLYGRGPSGWETLHADPEGRTREPCPMVVFNDGRLLLSANPTLTEATAHAGPARPEILQFRTDQPKAAFERIVPRWQGSPPFSEHSYRSFAADASRGELLLLQNIGYTHAEWAFRDSRGEWRSGRLAWPFGSEYPKPQPIRVCYPTVALKDRAVHFCGVSDIVEPYPEWRAYKKELSGRDWDYDFRRLFYTWCDDITTGQFQPWLEVASRDKTGGWISPCDLWIDARDRSHVGVHLLWTERAIDTRLRPRFFPDAKQSYSLNWALVRNGRVSARRTLLLAEEGSANEIPGAARFHTTPDGRLYVLFYVSGLGADGRSISENRLMELGDDGTPGTTVTIPMKHPMNSFFTATVRAGSAPSEWIDMLGTRAGEANCIYYARLRLVR